MTFLEQEKNNVKPTPDVGLSSKVENMLDHAACAHLGISIAKPSVLGIIAFFMVRKRQYAI